MINTIRKDKRLNRKFSLQKYISGAALHPRYWVYLIF
jgi:hypothetical protein